MKKYPLIGISIAVVCLIVLASFTNVVGVQTVKTTNHSIVNDEVDQKELLFQTIFDIANNKEIQKITFSYDRMGKGLFNPSSKFSVFIPSVMTKKFLNTAYHIGLILSKTLSKSKIHTMLERYRVNHQEVQKEITAVIENDAVLNDQITKLSNSKCGCENESTTRLWNFPVLCTFLYFLFWFSFVLWITHINTNLGIFYRRYWKGTKLLLVRYRSIK